MQPVSVDSLSRLLLGCRWVDLTHPLEEHMPMWPGQSRYYHTLWDSYWHGDVAVDYQLLMNEHTGTHVDAPAHFLPDPSHPRFAWVHSLPLTALVGRARVVHLEDIAPGTAVTLPQLQEDEARHGAIATGDIVLFSLGWAPRWQPRPAAAAYQTGWPYLSVPVARYLAERGVKAVGTDTLAPDGDGDGEFPVHRLLLGEGILILENLANLASLPPSCLFLALPLAIREGSGSPLRAVALVPEP